MQSLGGFGTHPVVVNVAKHHPHVRTMLLHGIQNGKVAHIAGMPNFIAAAQVVGDSIVPIAVCSITIMWTVSFGMVFGLVQGRLFSEHVQTLYQPLVECSIAFQIPASGMDVDPFACASMWRCCPNKSS